MVFPRLGDGFYGAPSRIRGRRRGELFGGLRGCFLGFLVGAAACERGCAHKNNNEYYFIHIIPSWVLEDRVFQCGG